MADSDVFPHKGPAFLDAVAGLCGLSNERIEALCERVLSELSEGSREPLTAEERAVLARKLKTEDATPAIDALVFIFEQFAYHNASETQATISLAGIGVDDEGKAAAITAAWQQFGKPYMARLRLHTLGGPRVLLNSSYDSQLCIAESATGVKHEPNAVLQLLLAECDGDGRRCGDAERLSLQFDHNELYDFFKQIDRIQGQIDAIGDRRGSKG
eukprot:TRINITY_DN13324_c0_g1_i1.p1 TRINITY_DN13324_c0_g1~~TRINITY_DN13324_c0_g1_i1.p1  ORF type:complete len:245 (+),score=79.42 TRINITY_DN13324_c0_g1_i1:94-735(+)